VGVVTQPDRPAGRRSVLTPPPIKGVALEHGIDVFQPEKLRKADAIATLKRWEDIDAYVVAAFGQILPQSVLDIPRLGSINVHASLLPRWRGAAPIQAAIRAGDAETGITIMKMDAGLDTGPMLRARAIPIAPDEAGASLHDKLAALGAELLIPTLADYFSGLIVPQPQDDALATLAPRIDKDEGRIDWTRPAVEIERLVRAFTPWPGTFTGFNGALLKILRGTVTAGSAAPGQVIRSDGGLAVGTGDGLFVPQTVQLAGKNPVTAEDFARGYPDFTGATLG
ncbi:MAG TPA: methionyl-tRNA formyltransferase, partial [Aggregatilineales bacterium]|nr:methionyl-tRNA formyltransferase [Aggregatilineales bacterium]